jgi:hypothetical protein
VHEVAHAPCEHWYGKHDTASGRHRPPSVHVGVETTLPLGSQVGVPHGVPPGMPAQAPMLEEVEVDVDVEEEPVEELPDVDVVVSVPPFPPSPPSGAWW